MHGQMPCLSLSLSLPPSVASLPPDRLDESSRATAVSDSLDSGEVTGYARTRGKPCSVQQEHAMQCRSRCYGSPQLKIVRVNHGIDGEEGPWVWVEFRDVVLGKRDF